MVPGVLLAGGGGWLIALGGSWYYLLAGGGLICSGVLMLRRRGWAAVVFGAVLLATVLWAYWEVGLQFWPLLPRVLGPTVIGLLVLLGTVGAKTAAKRGALATGAGVLSGIAVLGVALVLQFEPPPGNRILTESRPDQKAADWRYYGRDMRGSRYSPARQIAGKNAPLLREAWTFRTGDMPAGKMLDENTPIQVGDGLFLCTPRNQIIALDPDTGKEKWRFDPKLDGDNFHRCRGLAYHEVRKPIAQQPCARRILGANLAAQLVALDADTGEPCPGFGRGGKVDLMEGQGEGVEGRYFQTSSPVVSGDLVVVGGWSPDNLAVGEASGVVRAFNAETGKIVWAWNAAEGTGKTPVAGPYRRGGPNVWSTPAVDLELGLIYLPTGNATPDFWASHRSDNAELYSSSVVALDLATGAVRWSFQTVHHDVWDYDIGIPPTLADLPDGQGGSTPALIQPTKRGQIFVLDRRTGAPLARVEERPAPTNAAKGEWLSPTQPYSVEMPVLGAERLSERMMWGVTPLDQLFCRIDFRRKRYQGDFTPPGEDPNIQYPGAAGGTNWGGGAYDPVNNLFIVGDARLPATVTLTPSSAPQFSLDRSPDRSAKGEGGVPYETKLEFAMSPLGVPCLAPPHGLLSAIDMSTRKIVWRIPVGTAESTGPLGWKSGWKIPLGTASVGGPAATAGGVVFHASTRDPYLRAYDVKTGYLLWQGRLPVASNATPMTYTSAKTGRQYVVVSAGGARNSPDRGDYVVAFALPETASKP